MQEKFMKDALKEAEKALAKEEVPVGAVIVKDPAAELVPSFNALLFFASLHLS